MVFALFVLDFIFLVVVGIVGGFFFGEPINTGFTTALFFVLLLVHFVWLIFYVSWQDQDESVCKNTFIIFLVSYLIFFADFFFDGEKSFFVSQEELVQKIEEKQSKEEKTEKKQIFIQANLEQTKEMMASYNEVVGKKYSPLYRGIKIRGVANQGKIIVEVGQQWFYLSKNDRQDFVKDAVLLWGGMLGARKIEFNADKLEFLFVKENDNVEVATWDSLWGPSIKSN